MSPFLPELSPGVVCGGGRASVPNLRKEPIVPGMASAPVRREGLDINRLIEGVAVRHPFFGDGKIEKKTGNRSVEVFFPRHGRKTLHLDYAKLEIID